MPALLLLNAHRSKMRPVDEWKTWDERCYALRDCIQNEIIPFSLLITNNLSEWCCKSVLCFHNNVMQLPLFAHLFIRINTTLSLSPPRLRLPAPMSVGRAPHHPLRRRELRRRRHHCRFLMHVIFNDSALNPASAQPSCVWKSIVWTNVKWNKWIELVRIGGKSQHKHKHDPEHFYNFRLNASVIHVSSNLEKNLSGLAEQLQCIWID